MTQIKRVLDPQYLDDLISAAKATRANPYSDGQLVAADVMIPLDDVTRDTTLQPRDGLKESHVRGLVEAIEAGVPIAPIVLYKLGETLTLVDGWHRWTAYQRTGATKIAADIYEGERDDAQAHAGAANVGDKLGLTASEKVRFLRSLLRLPKYAKGSDRALARMCGTSPSTVAKYKREMQRGAAGVQTEQVDTRSVAPPAADLEGIAQYPPPGRVLRRSERGEDELQPRPLTPGETVTISIAPPPAPPKPPPVRHIAAYTSRKRIVGVGWLREAEPASVAVLLLREAIPSGFMEMFEAVQLVPGGWLVMPLERHSEPLWAALDRQGLRLATWAVNGEGEVWLVWGATPPPRGVPRRVGDLSELVSALDAGSGLLVEI